MKTNSIPEDGISSFRYNRGWSTIAIMCSSLPRICERDGGEQAYLCVIKGRDGNNNFQV